MQPAQVFVLSAVFAVTLVMAQSAPYPGLLSGLFGNEDSMQPKSNGVDMNQILRRYYMPQQPDDSYNQFNPYGGPPNYGLTNFGQPNYPPMNFGQSYPQYPVDQQFGGPNPVFDSPYSGGFPMFRSQPVPRSPSSDDSLAGSHYSSQLDSLLPGPDKLGFQNFASFRNLNFPSAEAQQSQHNGEALPPSQSALRAAPATRILTEGNGDAATVKSNSSEMPSGAKQ